MLKNFRFPIRFKILVTLLVVITLVVSMITFIMANLFHADKTAYIKDLTSTTAINQAEKTHALLDSYRKELLIFSRLMLDRSIPAASRNRLLQKSFVDFKEFVAVTLYQDDREPVTIFDAEALKSAGLNRTFLDQYQTAYPLPLQEIQSGRIHIINATRDEALPVLLVAISPEDENDSTVVSGLIRLNRLLQFSRQSQVFETSLINTEGHYLIHADNETAQKTTFDLPIAVAENFLFQRK